MRIKQMIRAIYSAKAVYELRKNPTFITILIAILFGILHMTPFTIRFFLTQTYRFDTQIWAIDDREQAQLLQNLPEDCYILDAVFNCNKMDYFIVGEDVSIHFNDADIDIYNGIVFMESYFIFATEGHIYALSYQSLDGLNFGHLQSLDNGYEILFTRIADALRGMLIVSFVLGVYQTGIVSFFIYILGVSILSMLLKFGHTSFINFKEMFNIMVFASLLPIVVMITIGFFIPGVSMIIFNMGTPLWAYVVYKKYIISGLQKQLEQSSSNEEVNKKECE